MISVSGVRGIVGDGLTPQVVGKFAQAYGSEFGPGRIVVGRDSRTTGEMIKYAVWAGILSTGCDVIDLGIAPTPTTEMITELSEHAGGIIITASHNPKEWNALKLLAPDGLFLNAEQGEKIATRVRENDFEHAPWDKIGRVIPCVKAIDTHIRAILNLSLIDVQKIRGKRFKVVVDCCHGAGGTILPNLLDELGCQSVYLNLEPNGLFPRNPEPVPEHLGDLRKGVISHRADLGIAVDPDVDRLALVSEKGEPLGEEYTLALATELVLSKKKGQVVVNASTSRVIDDIASKYNCPVHRTRVGEIHVATKAREVSAVIAGEGNGGVIYPELHLGRDAPAGIGLILQLLAERDRPVSEIHNSLPHYTMIKDKISLPFEADAHGIVAGLRDIHKRDKIDTTDGLKFLFDDAWVHIRASNTEPIIRVIAEATTRKETERLVDRFKAEISRLESRV
jgi:phosphomannomutase